MTIYGKKENGETFYISGVVEMGVLQERITSTKTGSITSVQAVYVPADDLTDPSPATTFAHLDATVVLSRAISELGIYPAVDPLDSTSRQLDPLVVGQEHYDAAESQSGRQHVYPGLRGREPHAGKRQSVEPPQAGDEPWGTHPPSRKKDQRHPDGPGRK